MYTIYIYIFDIGYIYIYDKYFRFHSYNIYIYINDSMHINVKILFFNIYICDFMHDVFCGIYEWFLIGYVKNVPMIYLYMHKNMIYVYIYT